MVQPITLQQQQARPSRRRSTEGYEPRYQVREEQDGFWVEGRERHPVYVALSPSRTLLLVGESREAVCCYDERAGRHQAACCFPCGLYQYYHLLEAIASMTMQDWQPPADAGNWGENAVRIWAMERTTRAMHRRGVYEQWQRLLSLVPEHKRLVSKAVFAATFDRKGLGAETWPEVYEHPYLVSDILSHRAAAVAVHYADAMAERLGSLITHLRELGYDRLQIGPLEPPLRGACPGERGLPGDGSSTG